MPAIYTAGDVMNDASVLLNDARQALFNYSTQLPFLKMVMRDLDQLLTLNENPINLIAEAEIVVLANATALALPSNFFIPISLMEKGSSDTFFSPMTEIADVEKLQVAATTNLGSWDFRHNDINFVGSIVDRTVKLIYWRNLDELIDEDSLSEVSGARNFLSKKTAAMCAQYIGNNTERAGILNADAMASLDLLLSIGTKNNQGKRVRRKPFRLFRRSSGSPVIG